MRVLLNYFHSIYDCSKNFAKFLQFTFSNEYKKNDTIQKTNMASRDLILNRIDQARNHLLEVIKHDDLMSEKQKSMFKNGFQITLIILF